MDTNDTTRTTRQTRAFLATATAVLLLPALLTACSGGSPDSDETATGSSTTGSAAKGSSLASCMRDQGYDMPDPDGSRSTMQLSAPDGVDPDQYRDDLKNCLGDGTEAGDVPAAKPMGPEPEQARKAAACIRDHGFADYPDDEEGKIQYRPDDEAAFDEVARSCDAEAFGGSPAGVAP
ncbi:hypothetical protein BIU98_10255 [Curtobacterium sp. MMLR14_010]|uniref:hypothetical protein n=1 Tax=Curtobacterium sp. MMLR14_010 TaxID=1898743 RepID=UPI0008DE0B9F|nr:hypothetical protein [Curtobacterium sp. MMLR14_010]OII29599.1 hypothetical protein BIU98_10255 [Curtobacterium sp. MMLR14_010]